MCLFATRQREKKGRTQKLDYCDRCFTSCILQSCEMVTLRYLKHERSRDYGKYLEINALEISLNFRIYIKKLKGGKIYYVKQLVLRTTYL